MSEPLAKELADRFTPPTAPSQGADLMPRDRLRCLTARIYSLGPRPLFELFVELEHGAELRPTLERYAELDGYAGLIRSVGGDRLPQARLVR